MFINDCLLGLNEPGLQPLQKKVLDVEFSPSLSVSPSPVSFSISIFLSSCPSVRLSPSAHLFACLSVCVSVSVRSSTDTRVFRIPSFRTKSCGQRSFSHQAPVIWNQLPVSVRHSTSVSSFKSSLKTFLFLKTFSSASLP